MKVISQFQSFLFHVQYSGNSSFDHQLEELNPIEHLCVVLVIVHGGVSFTVNDIRYFCMVLGIVYDVGYFGMVLVIVHGGVS